MAKQLKAAHAEMSLQSDELLHEKARFAELEAKFDQFQRDAAATNEAIMASNQRLHARLHAKTAALTRARCMIAELIDEGQLPR